MQKIKLTFAQVKQALKDGFIAPLSSAAKKLTGKAPAFKTGKLRRNATKKINWLLDSAKEIAAEGMTRGLDDCFSSNGWVFSTKDAVIEWLGDRFGSSYTNIYLTCDDNGKPQKLEVNGSHWETSFIITF